MSEFVIVYLGITVKSYIMWIVYLDITMSCVYLQDDAANTIDYDGFEQNSIRAGEDVVHPGANWPFNWGMASAPRRAPQPAGLSSLLGTQWPGAGGKPRFVTADL